MSSFIYGSMIAQPVGTFDLQSTSIEVKPDGTYAWKNHRFETGTVSIKQWALKAGTANTFRLHRYNSVQKFALSKNAWEFQLKIIIQLLDELNAGKPVESIDWAAVKKQIKVAQNDR